MIRTSQFLAAFREPEEALHLRCFKPKKATNTPDNEPLSVDTTLSELTADRDLQLKLIRANETRGVYFAPNVGGSSDESIVRLTAFFCEADDKPVTEQNASLDEAPLQPSIRVETRNSVHAYWPIEGTCNEAEWRDVQERLISFFQSDPKIKNPSRVMRLPGFDHLHLNGGPVIERRKVVVTHFEPNRRYSVEQMRDAFPANAPTNVLQRQQSPAIEPLEYHEQRHEELCQRIMVRGKRNSKGNWDAQCLAHNGNGKTGLVYFPSTGAVKCNREPPCSYFEILRAEGLSDKHLPSRIPNKAYETTNDSDGNHATGLSVVRMADVMPEEVSWLWEPYIALGKLTLLEGDPGIGKSWITAALACAVSLGQGLSGMVTEPGNVLMLSAEDGLADTLRPRLDAVRADVSRVFALNEPLIFDAPGLLRLEAAIAEYKPLLITIDPLFAFTGGKMDIHRANECRTVTSRLAAIAEKYGSSIIGVRHLGIPWNGPRFKCRYRKY